MKKLKDVALGVITAIGGFVDAGELITSAQAGALFCSMAAGLEVALSATYAVTEYFGWHWKKDEPPAQSALMDQNLIDCNGERCGRVDDIVVEDVFDRPARVVALLSGGGAKSRQLWEPLHRLSLWLHAALGVPRPVEPITVPWDQVDRVEQDVILKGTADEYGLNHMNRAVAERLIGHIPGANE
ncbi:MAG TPA: hypothetical protein VF897_02735 [Roseiflexaceae bacterium]